jgi:hypothetical protein
MQLRKLIGFGGPAVSLMVLAGVAGCGAISGGTLPATVLVELPDGTAVEVEQGAGVPSLADTTWQFFQTAGNAQTTVFLTITFGENGNLERFDENSIAPEVFGDTIVFDGVRYNTLQPGVTYEATTYAASTADGSGFAFEGRLVAFAAGLSAATSNATASGYFDPEDPSVMTGTFDISTRSTFPGFEQLNSDVSITFLARRVR